ncbi:hypothetical protein KZ813_00195 [Sphingomonas sp. RHCKR7]|uniref:hypothetical protein n=1 Tax=Sphingomonas folli TaxID=2862497 RepID=UPI001CA527CC|nr:hypothetical protein [Sphingomonas folli]MBW6525255.1 hypothetical protein [Sphingomonas folli]
MSDARWTGRHGEKAFSLLCSKHSVTCNKADEDDLGWDYILHFPPPNLLHLPTDRRSSGIAALVQIKATQVAARRWSISLKNALSLIRSPLPAFIVCVEIDASDRETFHAIHLWREDIATVLKAARRAYVERDEVINHRTISFQFGDETRRPDVLGWMSDEIERVGGSSYAALKQLLVDTLGFEDGHGIARIQFSNATPSALADLQLGLIDSLEIDRFSLTPIRFGIESPEPEIEVQGGTIEIMPQGRRGTLRLRSPDGRQAFMPAEVYSAGLPGRRRKKVRIKAGFIDVILSAGGRLSVRCREDRDRIAMLDHIAGLALLRRSTPSTKLNMSIRTDHSWIDLGYVNNAGSDPGWEQLVFVIDALRRIAAFDGAEPVASSINAINDRFLPLSVLEALVSTRPLRIEFTPTLGGDAEVGAFLAYASVVYGDMEVGAVAFRRVTADTMIGERRRIDLGPATPLHCATDVAGVRRLPDLYMDELDRLSEHIDVLAMGDLQRSVHPGEERELLVDSPRRTPERLNSIALDAAKQKSR